MPIHGLLPASKEVVLEIQLNKLINEFLFSSSSEQSSGSHCDGAVNQNGPRLVQLSLKTAAPNRNNSVEKCQSGSDENPSWSSPALDFSGRSASAMCDLPGLGSPSGMCNSLVDSPPAVSNSTGLNSPSGICNKISTMCNSPGLDSPLAICNKPSTMCNSPGPNSPSAICNKPLIMCNSPGPNSSSTICNKPSTMCNSPGPDSPSAIHNSQGFVSSSAIRKSPDILSDSSNINCNSQDMLSHVSYYVQTDMPIQDNHMTFSSHVSKCGSATGSPNSDNGTGTRDAMINVLEQNCGSCDQVPSDTHPKAPRLTKSYSESGPLFYLSVETTRRHPSDAPITENGSIKLTRIGSMPCQSKQQSEAEQEVVKHTCRKPPRPPRPASMHKDRYSLLSRYPSETILVLHSSRRAKLERRRRLAAASSSTASTWALVFTFFFATIIIGEGFWSHDTQSIHSFRNGAAGVVSSSETHLKTDPFILSRKMHLPSNLQDLKQLEKEISDLHSYNEFEKEMQMRALWIASRLEMEAS